jgi:hypothetical protein
MTALATILSVSVPTVSKAVRIGEQIEKNYKYDLYNLIKV